MSNTHHLHPFFTKYGVRNVLISSHVAAFIIALTCTVSIGGQRERGVEREPPSPVHSAAPQRRSITEDDEVTTLRAERLQGRLQAQGTTSPAPYLLEQALDTREDLLKRSLEITVTNNGNPVTFTLPVSPEWITLSTSLFSASYRIDPARIAESIRSRSIKELAPRIDGEITSAAPDHRDVQRVTTTTIAKPGYDFDIDAVAREIADALNGGEKTIAIIATKTDPVVRWTQPDGSVKTLTMLSTGLSDFADSTPGRLHNVHKAFEEKIHNVLIPSGAEFSLVPVIDAPITLQKGWKEDLGLFGGGAAKTPGAGICQSATTIYRAALLAGLPITERRYHSLFVDHYEFYGVGLDATVFPGVHNLRFRNDTANDILMQAYLDGTDAFVHFYGTPDGRTAELDGPYFMRSKNRPSNLRALGPNEIGWVRTVTMADGTVRSTPITSSYAKPFFGYVARTYEGSDGMALLAGQRLEKK